MAVALPRGAGVAAAALLFWGCAVAATPAGPSSSGAAAAGAPQAARLDPAQQARLRQILTPLIRMMDHPIPADRVKIGVIRDSSINAASAGEGQFYVTTGLLQKADDRELRAVLAHEVAHDDLGHVAKAQTLGAGLSIATVLLQGVFPTAGAFAPIAGELVSRAYGRSEEYQADAHGVQLLERLGYSKNDMANTLQWLEQQPSANGGGGFFSTHPATPDRIDRVRKLA